jgi:hypothetical protein
VKKIHDTQDADITNYDRGVLLRFGVISWSYPVTPVSGKENVEDGLDQLDEPTAKFLAQEVFDFSRPETKAEAKND